MSAVEVNPTPSAGEIPTLSPEQVEEVEGEHGGLDAKVAEWNGSRNEAEFGVIPEVRTEAEPDEDAPSPPSSTRGPELPAPSPSPSRRRPAAGGRELREIRSRSYTRSPCRLRPRKKSSPTRTSPLGGQAPRPDRGGAGRDLVHPPGDAREVRHAPDPHGVGLHPLRKILREFEKKKIRVKTRVLDTMRRVAPFRGRSRKNRNTMRTPATSRVQPGCHGHREGQWEASGRRDASRDPSPSSAQKPVDFKDAHANREEAHLA